MWRGQAAECMNCFRLFHSGCLSRVRLTDRKAGRARYRTSYYMCDRCIRAKPLERAVMAPRHPPRSERKVSEVPG